MIQNQQSFCDDGVVSIALIKKELNKLATLRKLTMNKQFHDIRSNFEARKSRETENVFHLRFRWSDSDEAETILATLVSAHEYRLTEKYRLVTSDTPDLLLKYIQKFESDLAALSRAIEEIENQISVGQTDEDTQSKLKQLQEKFERLQMTLDEYSRQYKQQRSSWEKRKATWRDFSFETLSPASKGVWFTHRCLSFSWLAAALGRRLDYV